MSIATVGYHKLLKEIVKRGGHRPNRTGIDTQSIFGTSLLIPLHEGFPLLTTRRLNVKAIVNEFLWMVVEGSTDVRWLRERGHTFWDAWAKDDGTIGPGYGHQFRYANGIDQVRNLIDGIKADPYSRRHIITLWNTADIPQMALPPCHGDFIQFYVSGDGRLSCLMVQRSADVPVGLPWNIGFYALFTHVVAHLTGTTPHALTIMIGDAHVYDNQLPKVEELLDRDPHTFPLPKLSIADSVTDIDDLRYEDILLTDYKSYPEIRMPVAV